jgi:hypothetical protein
MEPFDCNTLTDPDEYQACMRQQSQAQQIRQQPQQQGLPPGAGQVAQQFMGGGEGAAAEGAAAESGMSALQMGGTALAGAAFLKAAKDSGAMDKNMEVLEDMWQGPKDLGNRTKDLAAKMKFWKWF